MNAADFTTRAPEHQELASNPGGNPDRIGISGCIGQPPALPLNSGRMSLRASISSFWNRSNGGRDILRISLPLLVSMSSHTVMLFTDRLFLGRYSFDAIAAATPSGMTAFMFTCFFSGTVTFTNTLVAQYVGAGAPRRAGAALWQAIYFALGAGAILAALSGAGRPLFRMAGHPAAIQGMEHIYFSILMQGSVFALLHDALSCFFSGRGKTRTIMTVNLTGMAFNVPLDYALINGAWGFPELGIAGAALATVASHVVMLLMFAAAVFNSRNERLFAVRTRRAFDPEMFGRLARFGAPSGIQFFVDIFAFAFFMLVIGRLGRNEAAATSMAFSLNSLTFMPMIGFSIAVSTLVGQSIGRGRPEDAVVATRSALTLTLIYMWSVSMLFFLAPGMLCDLFASGRQDPSDFAAVRAMAVNLIRLVAFYSLMDALAVIYSGALKGAGDTRFIGFMTVLLSIFVMIVPVYVAVLVLHAGLYTAWGFVTLYVCLADMAFFLRFRNGRWKHIRVIERACVDT